MIVEFFCITYVCIAIIIINSSKDYDVDTVEESDTIHIVDNDTYTDKNIKK